MTQLALNCKNPRAYQKQWDFLNMDRSGGDVHCSHFVGGRGCAKTTTGVLVVFKAAFIDNPGLPGLVTEPTYRHLYDVFLREWESIVPKILWSLNKSLMRLELITGGTIDLRSRSVDSSGREIAKGPNYAWAIDDEAAYGFRAKQYQDIHASIRHPDAKSRFHVTLTTPKCNDYQKLVKTPGHVMIQATSFDNPFLPPNFASDLEKQMSKEYARQEIYGDFIAQSGRIWKDWSDERWPKGNILEYRHDPSKPWELWCDLGVMSSWLCVQRIQAAGQPLLCVTREWQPNNEGAAQTIQRISRDMGGKIPARVIVGADVNTRSVAIGERPIYYFRQAWGDSCVVQPVTGDLADKGLQHMAASSAILNSAGHRRLVAASQLISHDHDNGRGFVDMMRTDQWGENPRLGEYMPKTKGRTDLPNTEDTRDAMLYGVIVNCPPQMSKMLYQVAV
jgi:hypothetical protein